MMILAPFLWSMISAADINKFCVLTFMVYTNWSHPSMMVYIFPMAAMNSSDNDNQ